MDGLGDVCFRPHNECDARGASQERRRQVLPFDMSHRPFGLWTLAMAVCWVAATVMACLLLWRLWTNFPR